MDRTRWQNARRLFEDAIELAGDARREYLDRECADDTTRREVESLLAAVDGDADPTGVVARAAADLAGESPERLVGRTIGGFRLLRVLGVGGMGAVFEAEQERPRRRVALKTMRRGLDSPRAHSRFEYESEILARLRHPGIARVYEVGTFGDGGRELPYYAMELVENAEPLDAHLHRAGAEPRAVAELFATVCDAVQHGHQNGFLHRDLKPQNVLVDRSGQIKVIDFGIARATTADERATLRTAPGQILGTLQYMSPEQLDCEDVDVRSDVYALGVMLYELLARRPAFDFDATPLPRAAERIRTERPISLAKIRRVPRDLDWIVDRAMAKEPERRYRSALELGDDLRRFLRGEPVTAGPPSTAYRVRKFVVRHRVPVAAFSLTVLALVCGTVFATIGLVRARDAEALAEQRQRDAEAEAQRLRTATDVFAKFLSAGRAAELGRNVSLADAAGYVAKSAEQMYPDRPQLRMIVLTNVGELYGSLGMHTEALAHHRRAVELAREHLTEDHLWLLAALRNLGTALSRIGDLDASVEVLEPCVAGYSRRIGDEAPRTNRARHQLGQVYNKQGRLDLAERTLRVAHQNLQAALGDDDLETIGAANSIATTLESLGRLDEAEQWGRDALARALSNLGARHPSTLTARNNLATILLAKDRPADAEHEMRINLEVAEELFGDDHPTTLLYLQNTAAMVQQQNRIEEAVVLQREVLARYESRGDRDQRLAIVHANNLGRTLLDLGRVEEAHELMVDVMERARRVFPADHWMIGVFQLNLGNALRALDRADDAEPVLLDALDRLSRKRGVDHPNTAKARTALLELYERSGRTEDAARVRGDR